MTRDNRHPYTSDVEDQDEGGYNDQWPGRLPSSSRRYRQPMTTQGKSLLIPHPGQVQRTPIPARRSAQRLTEEPPAPPHPRRRSGGMFRSHPLLWVGFGMLAMLLMWTGLQALGAWWSLHQDDVTYGRPRNDCQSCARGGSDIRDGERVRDLYRRGLRRAAVAHESDTTSFNAGKPSRTALRLLLQQTGIHTASITGIPDNQLLPDDLTHLHLLIIMTLF